MTASSAEVLAETEKALIEATRCRLCRDVMQDACALSCGHCFCTHCLLSRARDEYLCPECCIPFYRSELYRSQAIDDLLIYVREKLHKRCQFAVGDFVTVSRLMTPGNCREGGPATIVKVNEEKALYDVRYFLHNGRDRDLKEKELEAYDPHAQSSRKRSQPTNIPPKTTLLTAPKKRKIVKKGPRKRKVPNKAPSSRRYRVTLTKVQATAIIEKGLRMCADVVPVTEADLIVTGEKLSRTPKLMAGIAAGISLIVDKKWLVESARTGTQQDPRDYMITDPEAEAKWHFSLSESLAKNSGPFFRGLFFLVAPTSTQKLPPPADIKLIVTAAGGILIESLNDIFRQKTHGGLVVLVANTNYSSENTSLIDTLFATSGRRKTSLTERLKLSYPQGYALCSLETLFQAALNKEGISLNQPWQKSQNNAISIQQQPQPTRLAAIKEEEEDDEEEEENVPSLNNALAKNSKASAANDPIPRGLRRPDRSPRASVDDATDVSEKSNVATGTEVPSLAKARNDSLATDVSSESCLPRPSSLHCAPSIESSEASLPRLSQIGDSFRDEPTLKNTQEVDKFIKSMMPAPTPESPRSEDEESQYSRELSVPRLSQLSGSYQNEDTLKDSLEVDNLIKSGLAAAGISEHEEYTHTDHVLSSHDRELREAPIVPPRHFASVHPLDGTPEDSQEVVEKDLGREIYPSNTFLRHDTSNLMPPRDFLSLYPQDGTPEDSQIAPQPNEASLCLASTDVPVIKPEIQEEDSRPERPTIQEPRTFRQTYIVPPKPPNKRHRPHQPLMKKDTRYLKRRPMQSDIRSHLYVSSKKRRH